MQTVSPIARLVPTANIIYETLRRARLDPEKAGSFYKEGATAACETFAAICTDDEFRGLLHRYADSAISPEELDNYFEEPEHARHFIETEEGILQQAGLNEEQVEQLSDLFKPLILKRASPKVQFESYLEHLVLLRERACQLASYTPGSRSVGAQEAPPPKRKWLRAVGLGVLGVTAFAADATDGFGFVPGLSLTPVGEKSAELGLGMVKGAVLL